MHQALRGWGPALRVVSTILRGFCAHCVLDVVQLLSHVQLFATPWTEEFQAPLSPTISKNLLRFMSGESLTI